jgi:hypothetical protein
MQTKTRTLAMAALIIAGIVAMVSGRTYAAVPEYSAVIVKTYRTILGPSPRDYFTRTGFCLRAPV